MQKLQMLLEQIAQAQISTENHRQKKNEGRKGSTRQSELNTGSKISLPFSFIACVAASTFVITFALFCYTVRTFPGGGIRIEVPGGVRVEAQLGNSTLPEKNLTPSDRRVER
jgi:hypothetical protein